MHRDNEGDEKSQAQQDVAADNVDFGDASLDDPNGGLDVEIQLLH